MDGSDKYIPFGELALLAVTRVALGVGIGLLIADRVSKERRTGAGWSLVAIGAITTIPLALDIFSRREP